MKNNLNGLRFAIYARKSTESEDRQVQSIQDQISRLEELAKRDNLDVISIYKESKSAKNPHNRPQFNKLLEDIRNGEIDGILCWSVNRLARNNVDNAEIQWELQEGSLQCIKTPEKNYLPEDSGLLFTLESAMASEFIRDLRKSITRGMKSKIDKGILPCMPPLGYTNCPSTRTIIPEEKYFPLVRKMWDLMLTGSYTPPQIVKIVNEKWGFKTPLRKNSGGTPLSRSSIYKIFENEFYAGVITWNGEKHAGVHEQMITSEEFERVQTLIRKREKMSEKKNEFAYTGMIRCEECGCLITAQEKKKKLKDGSINFHQYYHCTGKSKYHDCSQKKYIKKENLENQIANILKAIEIKPDFKEFALEIIKEKYESETKEEALIEKALSESENATQKKLDNLIDLRTRDLLNDDEFLKRKEILSNELASIKEKRNLALSRAQNWQKITEQAFDFATFVAESFQKSSPKKKKEIVASLGQNHRIKDGKLAIDVHPWLEVIAEEKEGLKAEIERSELLKNHSTTRQSGSLSSICPSWYTRRDSNPRHPVPKTGALSS